MLIHLIINKIIILLKICYYSKKKNIFPDFVTSTNAVDANDDDYEMRRNEMR